MPIRFGHQVPVVSDDQRWRGLEFDAELMTALFGSPVTPDELLRVRAARRSHRRRRPTPAGAR
jgi:hypothetical protein